MIPFRSHVSLRVLLKLAATLSSIVVACCGRGINGRAVSGRGTKQTRFYAVDRPFQGRMDTRTDAFRTKIKDIPRGGDDGTVDGNDSDGTADSGTGDKTFEILEENIVYSGWRTINKRIVRMRNGKVVDFDLVGVKTGEGAVLIFAWDSKSKTATMIREYMPASHRVLWGLAAGLIEDKHEHNTELAARHELEEECHLKGGRWIPLLTQPAAMDKYSTTTIQCYLVIDPEPEENPKPLDDEEDIEIVSGVTIPEILEFVRNGEMNLVGGYGSLLAIQKLQELGEYP